LKWEEHKDANDVFLKGCAGDVSKFRDLVEKLTHKARSQPMPDIYSLQDVMLSGGSTNIADHPNRLHFPWKEVDEMAVLLPGSVLAVYATQTGMGKSAWATQVALHNARKYGDVVVSYQCELDPQEIAVMAAAQVLRKNRNFLTEQDMKEAASALEGVQFYIGNNPNLSDKDEILALLEAACRRFGATILVIDHFHFLTRSENNGNAIERVTAADIKKMAKRLGLKIINVGQPRKAQQSNRGKRTHITDAYGSGAYTDDADAVFAIHRELSKNDDTSPKRDTYESKTLIDGQKTRSKGKGNAEAWLTFFGEFACFESVTENYGD
jgi:replicative DNA helicase